VWERWLGPSRLCVLSAAAMVGSSVLGLPLWGLQALVGLGLMVAWLVRPTDFALGLDERAWRLLLVGAFVWLELVGLTRFGAFEVDGVAFGAIEQAVDNTHHGRFGASPMLQGNLFATAPALILLPVVLLHELWPTPLWLVVVGPLVVWLGLFPVRRLVRLSNGGPHGAMELGAALLWLGNGWTGRALADGFAIELTIPLLLAWWLVGWVERDAEKVALLTAALLVTKDEAVPVVLGLLVTGTLVERWRWKQALALALPALAWSFFTALLVRPRLLGAQQVAPWGPWEASTVWQALGGLARHPLEVLTSGWWTFFLPLALVPFRSVRAMGLLLPLVVLLGLVPRGWETPMACLAVIGALFGLLDVWAVWRAKASVRWREGLILGAMVAFGLAGPVHLRSVAVDVERLAQLQVAMASVDEAPLVCVQAALVPHLERSRRVVPWVRAECVDRPGAVTLLHPSLSPRPFTAADLSTFQAARRVEALPGGFVIARPSAQ
jgi:hypothetical protein